MQCLQELTKKRVGVVRLKLTGHESCASHIPGGQVLVELTGVGEHSLREIVRHNCVSRFWGPCCRQTSEMATSSRASQSLALSDQTGLGYLTGSTSGAGGRGYSYMRIPSFADVPGGDIAIEVIGITKHPRCHSCFAHIPVVEVAVEIICSTEHTWKTQRGGLGEGACGRAGTGTRVQSRA